MNFKKCLAGAAMLALFLTSGSLAAQELNVLFNHGLPKSGKSKAVFADFDQDGLQDAVLAGVGEDNQKTTAVYRNLGNGTFLNLSAGLLPLTDGDLAVADVNNDGRPDILLCGTDASGRRHTKLYLNHGNGDFIPSAAEFKGISLGRVALADMDRDGRTDVLLSGVDSDSKTSFYLYLQQPGGSFLLSGNNIPGFSHGDWKVADFNNDSYPDILQSGLGAENYQRTDLYINTKNGKFTRVVTDLPPLVNSMLATDDVDQDGFPDIFLAGKTIAGKDTAAVYINTGLANFRFLSKTNPVAGGAAVLADVNQDGYTDLLYAGYHLGTYEGYYYLNQGGGSFSLSQSLPGITEGDIALHDFNNDKAAEIFMCGYGLPGPVSHFFVNTNVTPNTLPTAPDGLMTISKGDSVLLYWNAGSDTETAAGGLSYDLYIGSAPGKQDILSPLASLATGWRKVSRRGQFNTSAALVKNLPEGLYYWGVQTVDASAQGSAFSAEGSFSICYKPDLGPDQAICRGEKIFLQQGAGTDVVNWYSKNHGTTPVASNTFAYAQTIIADDEIVAEVTKSYGCTLYDTILVSVKELPLTLLEPQYRVCLNEELNLTAGSEGDIVNWWISGAQDPVLTNKRTFSQKVEETFTLKVEVTDPTGCKSFQDVDILPYELPVVSLGNDQEVCLGTEVNLQLPDQYSGISWYSAAKGVLAEEGISYKHTALHTDTLWVKVQNASGCVNYDTLIIKVNELPLADAGADKIFCVGSSVEIGGTYASVEGLQFAWEPAAFLSDAHILNPLATVKETTTFYLTVTDGKGCVNYDTLTLYQDAPTVINTGKDRYICLGESTLLGGEPTATGSEFAYTYQWSPEASLDNPASANPVASPQETTTYQLVTFSGSCVVDTSWVNIEVKSLPVITLTEDLTIGFGESVTLEASGGSSYYWYPQTGLDNYSIPNPVASPAKTTDYFVVVTDAEGCESEAKVVVYVKNDLYIPNLFTPNKDGNNDSFQVYGNGIKEIIFSIYSPYGKLIFQTTDVETAMGKGWDGSVNGVLQESGIYQWSIKGVHFDGKPLQFKGNQSGTFKLIR